MSTSNSPAFPRTRQSAMRRWCARVLDAIDHDCNSVSRYDGVGAWAKDSTKIPLLDAVLYVAVVVGGIWATLKIAFWIWG